MKIFLILFLLADLLAAAPVRIIPGPPVQIVPPPTAGGCDVRLLRAPSDQVKVYFQPQTAPRQIVTRSRNLERDWAHTARAPLLPSPIQGKFDNPFLRTQQQEAAGRNVEMIPIEVYNPVTHVQDWRDGTYRVLRVETKTIGDLIVREFSTEVAYGNPKGMYQEIAALDSRFASHANSVSPWYDWKQVRINRGARISDHVVHQATQNLVARGSQLHMQLLTDVLDFAFQEYKERRPKFFTPQRIAYLREKAINSRNYSQYRTIYHKELNKKGLVASLGRVSVAYGAVKVYVKDHWEILYGPFGSAFYRDHYVTGIRLLHHEIGFAAPKYWDQPVPTLPMEDKALFGLLPSWWTSVPDQSQGWSMDQILAKFGYLFRPDQFPPGKEVDLSRGLQFNTGIKREDVRFAIKKGFESRGIARRELLTSALFDLHPEDVDPIFNDLGQVDYAWNNEEGRRVYEELGFRVLPNYTIWLRDPLGELPPEKLYALELTPAAAISAAHRFKYISEEDAHHLLRGFIRAQNHKMDIADEVRGN